MAFLDVIKYEGSNNVLVWKHPREDFNTNSQLIVHESQEAFLFRDGQILGPYYPGKHNIQTENIPGVRRVVGLFTGGISPNHYDACVSKDDYVSAIETVSAALDKIGQDDELSVKLNVFTDIYSAAVIKAAKDQYVEYNYDSIISAEEMLNNALSVIPNNANLQSEFAFYKEKAPTAFNDLGEANFGSLGGSIYSLKDFGTITDNSGNIHNNSFCPDSWNTAYDSSYARCVGDLDYQYTKITGTIFQNEKYSSSPVITEVLIKGYQTTDVSSYNSDLLWSGEISGSVQPVNFDVDLSGYKYIEITFSRDTRDAQKYMFLTDVYVWK